MKHMKTIKENTEPWRAHYRIETQVEKYSDLKQSPVSTSEGRRLILTTFKSFMRFMVEGCFCGELNNYSYFLTVLTRQCVANTNQTLRAAAKHTQINPNPLLGEPT